MTCRISNEPTLLKAPNANRGLITSTPSTLPYPTCATRANRPTRLPSRLKRLDNEAHQKLEQLRRFDRDAADVVDWLRHNRNRFRQEIFEPAFLCVTVPNRQYVDAVEACFGNTQLRTFVAQCEEDYQTLNRLCVDTPEALGRKARINTWFKARDESRVQPPPLPVDQLAALGFDGYAIDFVDCPEGLKWFLRADVRLHRTVCLLGLCVYCFR